LSLCAHRDGDDQQNSNDELSVHQNVPSSARVAAGALGFLIFSHAFDGPERYGASSFFETMPSPKDHSPRVFRSVSRRWNSMSRSSM
jgi:hypothetical protein